MRTKVTIKRGVVTMDVEGGHGEDCVRVTQPYVACLRPQGSPVHRFKPEYRGDPEEHEREVVHGG